MKKILIVMMVLCMVVFAMTGCSKKEETPAATEAPAAATEAPVEEPAATEAPAEEPAATEAPVAGAAEEPTTEPAA